MKIRKGISRNVILAFGLAFKVPSISEWRLFLHGLLGNMQEKTFSPVFPDKLCPVLLSVPGGFLNIMPECDPLRRDFYLNAFDYEVFCNKGKDGDVSALVEDKIDSFGIFGSKIVAVDYGS